MQNDLYNEADLPMEGHCVALNQLRRAIDNNPVAVVITGPTNSGKTTFLRKLENGSDKYVHVAAVDSIQYWPTNPNVKAVIHEVVADECYNGGKIPKYMTDIIKILRNRDYMRRWPPVSLVIDICHDDYHVISNDLAKHYLVELTEDFNQTITHPNGTILYSGPSGKPT